MIHKGTVISYNIENSSYGMILSNDNKKVYFEKFECNYDSIRIGDEVQFQIYESKDNNLEALDVKFLKNNILSEIDSLFQRKESFEVEVKQEINKFYVVDYKGIDFLFPTSEINETEIKIGDKITVFIKDFNYVGKIIVSQKESVLDNFHRYKTAFQSNETLIFKIYDFNEGGVLVKDSDFKGFIPNSHIFPLIKEDLKIDQTLEVKILSNTIDTGLKLSIKNHFFSKTIDKLYQFYKNGNILKGTLRDCNTFYYSVFYEGLELKMNKSFVINDTNFEEKEIEFKIISFNSKKEIAVSNIEASEFGILSNYLTKNQFIGYVKESIDSGLIIKLNEKYNTCFLHRDEISELLPWNYDFNKIKIDSKIKVSIKYFDHNGIYLSRIKYKIKEKRISAFTRFKIGQCLEVKIKDRISGTGVIFVSNNEIEGKLYLKEIFSELFESIEMSIDFIKFCNNYFKRNSILKVEIKKIDKVNNFILFDLDHTSIENRDKIAKIKKHFQ